MIRGGGGAFNRHRLDLIVLDRELGVVQHFERRLWSEEAVHDVLRGLAARAGSAVRGGL
jgi:hypothetical protein